MLSRPHQLGLLPFLSAISIFITFEHGKHSMTSTSLSLEKRKSKLEALRTHLAQGTRQARAGEFVDDFSMDALISDLDSEA
ncbi:hypothetical protein GCM10009022_23320 [Vreelandella titanicae]